MTIKRITLDYDGEAGTVCYGDIFDRGTSRTDHVDGLVEVIDEFGESWGVMSWSRISKIEADDRTPAELSSAGSRG